VPRTLSLEELGKDELKGVPVMVRVDYNVPLSSSGQVSDTTRLEASLPTLRYLTRHGARMILVSHLGRPDGQPDPKASLGPVAQVLEGLLETSVPLVTDPLDSPELLQRVEGMEDGEVILLENIRFHPGETENDPELVRALTRLCRVFVGDAFGAVHRAHASTEGVPRLLREKGGRAVAGHLVQKELRFLREALEDPDRPFVAVMGGAKISGKIDLIESILPRVDRLLIGGAMANTFFQALGLEVGKSLVEPDRVEMAGTLLERAGDAILLPVDCVVADEVTSDAKTQIRDRTEIRPHDRIVDIGPRSRDVFAKEIAGGQTLLWNGPMGVFEMAPFSEGTMALARAMAEAADGGATVVVGGGDSAAAAQVAGVAARLTHISTGGGASLDLLAGKPLPGADALESSDKSLEEV